MIAIAKWCFEYRPRSPLRPILTRWHRPKAHGPRPLPPMQDGRLLPALAKVLWHVLIHSGRDTSLLDILLGERVGNWCLLQSGQLRSQPPASGQGNGQTFEGRKTQTGLCDPPL